MIFPSATSISRGFCFHMFSWSIKKNLDSAGRLGYPHGVFSQADEPLGAVLGEYLSETHVRIIEAWQNAE